MKTLNRLFLILLCLSTAAFVLSGGEDAPRRLKKVRAGYINFPGYYEQDAQDRRSGWGYEYLLRMAYYTNWEIEYAGRGKTWAELQQMLLNGEIDFIAGMNKMPEFEKKFDFSDQPESEFSYVIAVKAGARRLLPGDYAHWRNIRVGILAGNELPPAFLKFAAEKKFTFVPVFLADADAMEKALQTEQVDALMTSTMRRTKNEWICDEFGSFQNFFAVRKGNRAMLDEINAAQRALNRDFPQIFLQLRSRYYSVQEPGAIPLTAEERIFSNFAKANGTVFDAVVNPDSPPFSSFRDGALSGILKDISEKITANSGLRIRILGVRNRKDYYRELVSGRAQIVFDMCTSPSQAEKMGFALTEPYFTATVSRLRRRDLGHRPETVAVLLAPAMYEMLLARNAAGEKIVYCSSIQDVIGSVLDSKTDAAYVLTQTAEMAVSEHPELTEDLMTGLSVPFSVGVRRGSDPRLASILLRSVNGISREDIAEILSKYSFQPQPFSLKRWIAGHMLYSALILLVPLLSILIFLAAAVLGSRKAYRTGKIIEKLPLRYFVIDGEGMSIMYSMSDLPNLEDGRPFPLARMHDPEIGVLMKKTADEVFGDGRTRSVNFSFRGKGRTAMVSRLPDSLFEKPAVIWISQDTDSLQKLQNSADAAAERFLLTIQSIGEGVLATDSDGKVTMLNPVAEKLTGWSQNEAAGKMYEEIFNAAGPDNTPESESIVRTALRSGRRVEDSGRLSLISRSGRSCRISGSASPIRDDSGRMLGCILVFRDITRETEDSERLASALKNAERLNSEMQDLIAQQEILLGFPGIYVYALDIDNDYRYTLCNRNALRLWNRSREEIIGKNDEEIFGKDSAYVQVLLKSVMQDVSEGGFHERILPLPGADGKVRISRMLRQVVTLPGGRHWIFGMTTDITEQMEAQKTATENAEWLRLTLNSIGDGVITTDRDGNVVQMNPVAERMTGVRQTEAQGNPHDAVFNIVSSVDDVPMISPVRRALRTGNVVELANHTELVSRSGKRYHVADSAAPIFDSGRRIVGAILVFRDVSEDYANRDRLSSALTGLEYASELANMAYFKLSLRSRKVFSASKLFTSLWPVRDGKAIPREEHIYEEDLPEYIRATEEILFGKQTMNTWSYRAFVNGELRYYRIRATVDETVRDDTILIGVIQDLTDLRQSERKLENAMKLWHLVLDSIPTMIFVKDADNEFRYTLSNGAHEKFLGYEHGRLIGMNDRDFFRNSPSIAAEVLSNDIRTMRQKQPMEFEDVIEDASGTPHHLRTTKIPFHSADGRNLLLGVSVDITKEFQQQESYRKLLAESDELRLRMQDVLTLHELLMNAMPIYIYAKDAGKGFQHVICNNTCSKLWQLPIPEIIGKTDNELFDNQDELRAFHEADINAMTSGKLCESVQPFTGKDGIRRIGRFFRHGIALSNGRRWLFSMMVDITKEEEQREKLATLLETFEYGSELTCSAAFRIDPATRQLTGTRMLGKM